MPITFAEALAKRRAGGTPFDKTAGGPLPVVIDKAMVMAIIAKQAIETFPGVTKAKAIGQFLETPLGQAFYGAYEIAPAPTERQDGRWPWSVTGHDPNPEHPEAKLHGEAKQLMRNGRFTSYAQAFAHALELHPEWYAEYLTLRQDGVTWDWWIDQEKGLQDLSEKK